jgi:hypothetical protein
MNPLQKILSALTGDVAKGVTAVFDKLTLSPEDRLKAEREVLALQLSLQEKVLGADVELAKAGRDAIVAEAQGHSWAQRNWRPVTMLSFVACILYNFIIAPLFKLPSVPIPADMWDLIKIGIGGYLLSRGAEKVIPQSRWGKQ